MKRRNLLLIVLALRLPLAEASGIVFVSNVTIGVGDAHYDGPFHMEMPG